MKPALPRTKDKSPLVEQETAEPVSRRGTETVLVVEDEAMVRQLVCQTLLAHGYTVLEAENADNALQLAANRRDPIQLLLTDVIMPQMNGRDLYQKISRFYPDIRVLFMSGYTNNVIAHHGVLEEGVNFLQKPFTVESLTRKVREVLG